MADSDLKNKPRKPTFRFRAMLNISMGILYIVLACILMVFKKFGTFDLSSGYFAYALGGILCLYGLFRIYRGIQDQKQSNDPDIEY